MSVAISVLVPVYNVETTIDRCVQSILRQSFKDFEIILVDDGSTDGSGERCDYYANNYNNVSVIHKENEGLGPTRNAGIRAAKGEYIYHCDSDDWLKEDLLEKVYKTIKQTDAQVLVFGYEIFTKQKDKLEIYDTIKEKSGEHIGKEAVRKFFVDQYFHSFFVLSACNRVYKRSFVVENELYFPPLRRSQDVAYSLLLFDHIEKLAVMEEPFYCYIIDPGHYKGRSYREMIDIYCSVYQKTKEYLEKWNLYDAAVKQKLLNNLCEQIANYSAYAFAVKYPLQWKENTKILLCDKEIRRHFSQYANIKKSKFMSAFAIAVRMKSPFVLLMLSKAVHRKQKGK